MPITALAPSVAADTEKRRIMAFMDGFSIETTPKTAARVGDFRTVLRPGTRVMVTHLPGSELRETVDTAVLLRRQGFEPVPHIGARNLPNLRVFEEALRRLQGDAGVTEALVLGGGAAKPAGPVTSSLDLLRSGLFLKYGFRRLGVAGHPEGNPDIPEQGLVAALREKNAYAEDTGTAMYLITQFCFEAAPVVAWDYWLQAQGNRLPVYVGLPGLATVKTLLGHARACGVGPSMRVLTRSTGNLTKLMAVRSPARLLADLVSHAASAPTTALAGVHMYPLGGLARTAAWSHAIVDGHFDLEPDGDRIRLMAPVL